MDVVLSAHTLPLREVLTETGEVRWTPIYTKYTDLLDTVRHIEMSSSIEVENIPEALVPNIMNFAPFNSFRRINKLFNAVNEKLPTGGFFIGSGSTAGILRQEITEKYPGFLKWPVLGYYYLFHRVLAKLPVTRHIYFFLTRGRHRVVSRAEMLGRLISCGFDIVDEVTRDKKFYFVAKKARDPEYNTNPTYGALIRLARVGKGGRIFNVYKFRTMHPYSEYLQEYVHAHNGVRKNGKFDNDFRINSLGRFMRKIWLDEFPMFINFFKGELKLVGVRPLSRHYFSLYSEDLQQLRTRYRPGILPPFYVDFPETLEEIEVSERKYLELYDRHPFLTDFRYFFTILYNILIKRARSS